VYGLHILELDNKTKCYSYNKSPRDAQFLKFILINTLHVSDRSTVHHQESQH